MDMQYINRVMAQGSGYLVQCEGMPMAEILEG